MYRRQWKIICGGTGDECGMKFQNVSISCPGKKVQEDFHTHPYLDEVRKSFGITFKTSDELRQKHF